MREPRLHTIVLIGATAFAAAWGYPAPAWASAGTPPAGVPPIEIEVLGNYDGDTFRAQVPGHGLVNVRIAGFDTPEIRARCAAEQAGAVAARDALRGLLAAGRVTMDRIRRDKYPGRVGARVFVDGQDIASMMLARGDGLARPYQGGRRGSWCADTSRANATETDPVIPAASTVRQPAPD